MALAVEVSPEEAGVLGLAVGIHVDMQFAICLVEVAIELCWEEKRKLNGHHRQHAFVREHIIVLECDLEEVFKGAPYISNCLNVAAVEAS